MSRSREERALAQIRGLLAKAESTTFPEEAEALTAKAEQLIADYGVDRAQLAAAGSITDDLGTVRIQITGYYRNEKADMLSLVGYAMRCRTVVYSSRGQAMYVELFGFSSDRQRVELLFTSLLIQAMRAMSAAQPNRTGQGLKPWRRSFLLGFATRIAQRVYAAETAAATRAAESPGGTNALPVLRDRVKVVAREFEQRTAHVPTSDRRRTQDHDGLVAGHRAGDVADLGQARVDDGAEPAQQIHAGA